MKKITVPRPAFWVIRSVSKLLTSPKKGAARRFWIRLAYGSYKHPSRWSGDDRVSAVFVVFAYLVITGVLSLLVALCSTVITSGVFNYIVWAAVWIFLIYVPLRYGPAAYLASLPDELLNLKSMGDYYSYEESTKLARAFHEQGKWARTARLISKGITPKEMRCMLDCLAGEETVLELMETK